MVFQIKWQADSTQSPHMTKSFPLQSACLALRHIAMNKHSGKNSIFFRSVLPFVVGSALDENVTSPFAANRQ